MNVEAREEFVWGDCSRDSGHMSSIVQTIGRLPNVKTLTVRYGVASEFLELMNQPAEYWDGGEGSTY